MSDNTEQTIKGLKIPGPDGYRKQLKQTAAAAARRAKLDIIRYHQLGRLAALQDIEKHEQLWEERCRLDRAEYMIGYRRRYNAEYMRKAREEARNGGV